VFPPLGRGFNISLLYIGHINSIIIIIDIAITVVILLPVVENTIFPDAPMTLREPPSDLLNHV